MIRAVIKNDLEIDYRKSREVSAGGVPYFTEACVFVPELGLPMVICGPGDPRLAHQPDEHVELSQVEQAAQIYVQVIRRA